MMGIEIAMATMAAGAGSNNFPAMEVELSTPTQSISLDKYVGNYWLDQPYFVMDLPTKHVRLSELEAEIIDKAYLDAFEILDQGTLVVG